MSPSAPLPETPLVTIVTPSYNQADTLEATIRSVIEQDYPRVQYIVMDGGSTDQSADILRRYDDRLTWTSARDAGQADAIATGFAQAQGEVLAWLNSDDVYTPGAIARAVRALRDHAQAPLVYGDVDWLTKDGRLIGPCVSTEPFDRARLLHVSNFISQPSTFFRRDAYEAIGGLNRTLHYVMDYDLWLRLTRDGPAVYLPHTQAQVRIYPQTKSAAGGSQRFEEMRTMLAAHRGTGLPAYYRLEYAAHLAREAAAALRTGRIPTALRRTGRALATLSHWRVASAVCSRQFFAILRSRRRQARMS